MNNLGWFEPAEEYECKYGGFLWFPAKLFIYFFVLNVFVCALKTCIEKFLEVRANTGWVGLIKNVKTSGSFAWIKCDIDLAKIWIIMLFEHDLDLGFALN